MKLSQNQSLQVKDCKKLEKDVKGHRKIQRQEDVLKEALKKMKSKPKKKQESPVKKESVKKSSVKKKSSIKRNLFREHHLPPLKRKESSCFSSLEKVWIMLLEHQSNYL